MWPFGNKENAESSSSAGSGIDQCPVDHETRSKWLAQNRSQDSQQSPATNSALTFLSAGVVEGTPASTGMEGTITSDRHKAPGHLSIEREVSSIPRFGAASKVDGKDLHQSSQPDLPIDPSTQANWVYPSPAQFFSAMSRKNHNPQEKDMNIVVPIHNAVNERAWQEILQWERLADNGKSYDICGGPQLVSFKGKPKEVTWRAWFKSFLGYQKPFDRHDWEVDRCGKRIKYVIDFYTGRSTNTNSQPGISFYLDVRPSPAEWEGIRMRFMRYWFKPERQAQSIQSKV